MSSAGPSGSSGAPTLASLIPLVASISPELESEERKKLARMQLCNFSSFWSLGSHFRFLLKPHPYKTNWWTEERVLQGSSCACSEPWEVMGVSSEWTISPGALSLLLASGSSFLLLSLHRLQHCYEHWRWRRTCNDCTIWNTVVVYDLLTVDAEISYVLNFL